MPSRCNSGLSQAARTASLARMTCRSVLALAMLTALTVTAQPAKTGKTDARAIKPGEWAEITLKESPPPSDADQ